MVDRGRRMRRLLEQSSCLDGAREVDKNDVRPWMANARRSQRTHPSGK